MTWRAGLWVLSLLNACSSATPSPVSEKEPLLAPKRALSTADSSLLRFEISAEPGNGMSQAALRLSIENVSRQWIKVRRYLGLGYEGSSFDTVWLDITRVSDGSKLEPACSARHYRLGGKREFVQLAPGEQFSQLAELDCDYALPDKGPWRIVAHYQDKSEGPALGKHDDQWTWFNGQLESNSIEITVKPWDEVWDAWHEEMRRQQREDEGRRQQQ